jgi:hypothetical protein
MQYSGITLTPGFVISAATDPQFNYVTALLHGDGTNAGTNNTFLDSSTNNFAITRNGSATQGSFAPYGTLWSNYFNGSTDYLYIADNAAFNFGTGDATVEFWFNSPGTSNNYPGVISSVDYNVAGSASIRFDNTGYKGKAFMYINGGGDPVISSTSTIAYNTWNHIAIVRQGTSLKLYLNGALNTTVTISAGLGWYLSASGLRIGRGFDVDGVNGYYPGYISNVRLVKGTAVYTSNFTPSTTPLTAITNTSLLTCQSNRFKDNSTNNFAVTVNSTPSVQIFSPFGTTTQYDPNVNGGSAYFNGSTDYLLVGSTPGPITPLISAGAVMTIEAWVNATTLRAGNANDTHPSIIGLGAVYMNFGVANGIPRFMWYNGAVTYLDSSIAITANTWNHIAVVFNGSGSSNLKIYVNGVLGGTGTFTNLTWSTGSGGNNLYIGAVGNNQATSCWPGYISNLRITNSAVYTTNFTPPTAPVTAIANTSLLLNGTNGQIFDNAIMNNFVTAGSAQVSTSIFKYGTGSIAFNGSTSYLTANANLTNNFSTGNFTIECWVYFVSVANGQLVAAGSGSNTNAYYWQYYSGQLQFGVQNVGPITATNWTPSASTWYHVAVVRSGTNVYQFVDGTQLGTTATSSQNFVDGPTYVGYGGAGYLNGYIDELRISKGFARYTANFTAPTSLFPSTGPIPVPTPNVEYLVVAGGGGGGWSNGGGGGAGGYRTNTGLSVTAGSAITVTIGTGGAGSGSGHGSDGTSSVFGSITSSGGGGGGSAQSQGGPGNTGGSGGGGGNDYPRGTQTAGGTGNSGGYTPAEGKNGGASQGGGGGASTAGSDGSTNGVGGAGTYSSITGSSVARGGGGGGSTESATDPVLGGVGGGGNGQKRNSTAPGNGTVNTGGGGGGGANSTGGTGGSGFVAIRYTNDYLAATSTTGSPSITNTGGYWIYAWTSSGSITF